MTGDGIWNRISHGAVFLDIGGGGGGGEGGSIEEKQRQNRRKERGCSLQNVTPRFAAGVFGNTDQRFQKQMQGINVSTTNKIRISQ